MYFHKVDTPYNFTFTGSREHAGVPVSKKEVSQAQALLPGGETLEIMLEDRGSDVFLYRVASKLRWSEGNPSQAVLSTDEFARQPSTMEPRLGLDGSVSFSREGDTWLTTLDEQSFGVNGSKWMLCFPWEKDLRFYGMGEKKGFERSGHRTQFWNTDVMADFRGNVIDTGDTDPMYIALPVLIVRFSDSQGGSRGYGALVVNNPDGVFMNTAAQEGIFAFQNIPPEPVWYLGSKNWEPEIFFLFGNDFASVVRKIQTLQGRTPLPPLWALGHQQSRWGYKSIEDLQKIHSKYQEHEIPNDGIWLDIQYMRGYRVFTLADEGFDNIQGELADLRNQGSRVVPILDPGIKVDPEWDVYVQGKQNAVFCNNTEGGDYVGFVWPGVTVYPDYSLPEVRDWWARKVRDFTEHGFGGYWIDMNDPSSGSSPLEDMRFKRGALDHGAYHNQYALGMAQATRKGLEMALGNERPFLLSRSAYLSSSRYTAVWTGDNLSNVHHMRNGIDLTLSLGISGIPFSGPDVPGFAGDASAELMRAWYKACFLFPFLRNHNVLDAREQEPWTRDAKTLEIVTEYIRLRYKLLPYLYNLFIDQEELGDPILRPMIYHVDQQEFTRVSDQFFVGPAIIHAPVLDDQSTTRTLLIPEGRWFSSLTDTWVQGPKELTVDTKAEGTPLYFKQGAIVPMQRGVRKSNKNELAEIEFLIFWTADTTEPSTYRYRFDDGLTTGYLEGMRSEVELTVHPGKTPRVQISSRRMESGSLVAALVFPGSLKTALVEVDGKQTQVELQVSTMRIAGREVEVSVSEQWVVGKTQEN